MDFFDAPLKFFGFDSKPKALSIKGVKFVIKVIGASQEKAEQCIRFIDYAAALDLEQCAKTHSFVDLQQSETLYQKALSRQQRLEDKYRAITDRLEKLQASLQWRDKLEHDEVNSQHSTMGEGANGTLQALARFNEADSVFAESSQQYYASSQAHSQQQTQTKQDNDKRFKSENVTATWCDALTRLMETEQTLHDLSVEITQSQQDVRRTNAEVLKLKSKVARIQSVLMFEDEEIDQTESKTASFTFDALQLFNDFQMLPTVIYFTEKRTGVASTSVYSDWLDTVNDRRSRNAMLEELTSRSDLLCEEGLEESLSLQILQLEELQREAAADAKILSNIRCALEASFVYQATTLTQNPQRLTSTIWEQVTRFNDTTVLPSTSYPLAEEGGTADTIQWERYCALNMAAMKWINNVNSLLSTDESIRKLSKDLESTQRNLKIYQADLKTLVNPLLAIVTDDFDYSSDDGLSLDVVLSKTDEQMMLSLNDMLYYLSQAGPLPKPPEYPFSGVIATNASVAWDAYCTQRNNHASALKFCNDIAVHQRKIEATLEEIENIKSMKASLKVESSALKEDIQSRQAHLSALIRIHEVVRDPKPRASYSWLAVERFNNQSEELPDLNPDKGKNT